MRHSRRDFDFERFQYANADKRFPVEGFEMLLHLHSG